MPAAPFLNGGTAGTGFPLIWTAVLAFLFIFIMSFTLGKLPEGTRRMSGVWLRAWFKASLPRLVVAAVFSLTLFGLGKFIGGGTSGSSGSSGSSTVCEKGVSALTGQALTAPRLQAAVAAMRQVSVAARTGDLAGATALFFGGDTHNVTHDIDSPLRSKGPELATQLCRSVVILELQFPGQRDLGIITTQAQTSADLMAKAGQELGLAK